MNSFSAGTDQVAVDQGLESSGAVNAGKGIAREGEEFLPRPGGDQKRIRGDQHVLAAVFQMPTL